MVSLIARDHQHEQQHARLQSPLIRAFSEIQRGEILGGARKQSARYSRSSTTVIWPDLSASTDENQLQSLHAYQPPQYSRTELLKEHILTGDPRQAVGQRARGQTRRDQDRSPVGRIRHHRHNLRRSHRRIRVPKRVHASEIGSDTRSRVHTR